MKKRIGIFILSLGIIGILAACGSEVSIDSDKSVDIHAMASDLQEGLTFEDSLSEVNTDIALSYYGIDKDVVKDSIVILSTGATAEEIAIFEASSDSYVQVVKLACDTRKSKQTVSYADYKPAEVSRLDNAIIETNGRYVIYCVTDNVEKAEGIIDSYFGK